MITTPPTTAQQARHGDVPTTPVLHGVLAHPVAAEALLNGLPIGVVLLDDKRRVVRLNNRAEALLGLDTQSACGLPCHHVIRSARCLRDCPMGDCPMNEALHEAQLQPPPPGRSPAHEPATQTQAGACPVTHETDIIDRQRRKISVRSCVVPLHDGAGTTVGYMEVLDEISPCVAPAQPQSDDNGLEGFISHSPVMQPIFSAMRIIAETDSNLLITGETGTGKDLLAEALHKASPRRNGPFVKVNCGALPEHLLESELFGHMRGAFTGATADKPGRFRLASGGTLFLTEVGDLPLPLQVKLLTVLDDQCIYPLGATRPVSVDVRIIAATHRDLEAMVRQGRFREDLLFRLNVVRLHVPPLREREGDVRLLLEHFLRRMTASGKHTAKSFSPEALKLLCEYHWPGNVRELRNVVEYAVHFSTGDRVGIHSLPKAVLEQGRTAPPPASHTEAPLYDAHHDSAGHTEQAAPAPDPSRTSPTSPRAPQASEHAPVFRSWQEKERHMILDALEKTGGRRQQAADLLGWSRSTLWRKLHTHGLV